MIYTCTWMISSTPLLYKFMTLYQTVPKDIICLVTSKHIILGECLAFLASGSDPTVAKYNMIQLESLCSTGEAGSSLTYVHMTYPQTCSFMRKRKLHQNMHACEILAQRRDRRVSLSSAISVGRRSSFEVHVSQYLELGVWTHASATLRQSHAADRAFDFAKGTHAAFT